MKKILFLLFCFFAFPLASLALDNKIDSNCPSNVAKNFSDVFENINVSYSFKGYNNKTKKAYYDVTFSNLHKAVIISSKSFTSITPKYNGEERTVTISESGNIELFYIGKYNGCTIYAKDGITIPHYNPYYGREECNGLSSYEVCQRWSDFEGNEDKFLKAIESAKADKAKKSNSKSKTTVNNIKHWYTYIRDIFVNYWWAVILVTVGIVGLVYGIRLKNKKNEYNFKL